MAVPDYLEERPIVICEACYQRQVWETTESGIRLVEDHAEDCPHVGADGTEHIWPDAKRVMRTRGQRGRGPR